MSKLEKKNGGFLLLKIIYEHKGTGKNWNGGKMEEWKLSNIPTFHSSSIPFF